MAQRGGRGATPPPLPSLGPGLGTSATYLEASQSSQNSKLILEKSLLNKKVVF